MLAAAPTDLTTQQVDRAGGVPARVTEVAAAYDRMGGRNLWPGFDPEDVPIAIYDGTDTWLFRHPSPPGGFRDVPEADDAAVFRGRHEAIRANTSAELGHVTTVVIILEGRSDDGVEDSVALGLRRLETEALRTALSASGEAERSVAARRALELRTPCPCGRPISTP